MIKEEAKRRSLVWAAETLVSRFEEIFAVCEGRLIDVGSPLVSEKASREQLKAHAYCILEDAAISLHGREESAGAQRSKDSLSRKVGASRADECVHPSDSLRAAVVLSEAALSVVAGSLPPSSVSRDEIVAVASAIQRSILERTARASVAYGNRLLAKLHESHVDERRRISRELHDRVAHSMVVVFRNLELCEVYEEDPSKIHAKLETAKRTAQEALRLVRTLSSELRHTAAEEGLEVALSDYLRLTVTSGIEARISVRGDESLITPAVRDEIFLVLREAIRNALTHSGAQSVRIELCTSEHQVRAAVEDDGDGFDPKDASGVGGTGLISMRERTSLLRGTFSVSSSLGNGTRIEIVVPLPRIRL